MDKTVSKKYLNFVILNSILFSILFIVGLSIILGAWSFVNKELLLDRYTLKIAPVYLIICIATLFSSLVWYPILNFTKKWWIRFFIFFLFTNFAFIVAFWSVLIYEGVMPTLEDLLFMGLAIIIKANILGYFIISLTAFFINYIFKKSIFD